MADRDTKAALDSAYDMHLQSPAARAYMERHEIDSQPVLTVTDTEAADAIARYLEPRIAGKTVVEIGGGLGLLAIALGRHAKRVFCIEANPMWAAGFSSILFADKPKHVSYLFGAASEFEGLLRADVAVFCSHSDIDGLTAAARLFAPTVIDVYGEVMATAPGKFDPLASALRKLA